MDLGLIEQQERKLAPRIGIDHIPNPERSVHRQRRYRRIAWARLCQVLLLTSMQFRMLPNGFGFQDETSVSHDFLLHMQSFNYGMIAVCCGT